MRALFFKVLFIVSIFFSLLNTGCATVSGWMGMGKDKPAEEAKATSSSNTPRFSETQNLLAPSNRQYKRMTKSRLEEESEVHAGAGSMWVGEGQSAYLFSQNKSRKEGDLLNVKIEGNAQKQVETKVAVIKKLLKQLEEQKEKENAAATDAGKLAMDGGKPTEGNDKAPAARTPAAVADDKKKEDEPINIESVPTRIVERLPDGNYRVKGAQPFMIGKREYRVLVTGLVRAEDFNDDGISSNRLLDSQFDVVSLRKKETNL
jgi:flagellar L-ring protein precursor FlgH